MAEAVKLREKAGFEATTAELLFDIQNFLELKNGKRILSPVYTVGNGEQKTQWRVEVYPNGDTEERKGKVCVNLVLQESSKPEVLAKISFYLQSDLDQSTKKLNLLNGTQRQFIQEKPWGWCEFISTSEIMEPQYSQNGTVTFGCELTVYHEIITESELVKPPKPDFSDQLWDLYVEEEITDVTLEVGDGFIKCHKTVLCAGSVVFKKMFMNKEMLESQTGIVKLHNFRYEVVKKLVEFCYKGDISYFGDVTRIISDLLVAADFYQMPDLVRLCEYHLLKNLSAENVPEILRVAAKCNNSLLLERGVQFLKKNPDVMKPEEYKMFFESNHKLSVAVNAELCKKFALI